MEIASVKDLDKYEEKRDPTGNYLVHSVPHKVYKSIISLFNNYVFHRKQDGEYIVKTHIGQRRQIKKYLQITLK